MEANDEVDLLVVEPQRSFSRPYKASASSEILIPVIRPLLADIAQYVAELKVELPKERPYDGWFHPSTHPMWDARQLYFYLTAPDLLELEDLDESAYLSAIHGTFWHTAIQSVALVNELLLPQMSPLHPEPQAELSVVDEPHNTRGHLDGVLNPDKFPIEVPQGLEIKTLNGFRANDLPAGFPASPERIAWLKEKKPKYYWQAQEYMRMSGFRMQYFLFMGMDYPFPMAEVWLPYNEADALTVVAKYEMVLRDRDMEWLPDPCCSIKSAKAKQCPARHACPIGRFASGAA